MISRLKNGFSRQTNPRKLFHLNLEDQSVKTIALLFRTCDNENKFKWPVISALIAKNYLLKAAKERILRAKRILLKFFGMPLGENIQTIT